VTVRVPLDGGTGVRRSVAGAPLWAGLHLVVVGTETIRPPDQPHRLVSLGVVTCRDSRVTGTRSTLVNAGFPVDDRTAEVHGLAVTVLDANGNPVPKPRHHPVTPKRTRPLRFARVG
jgi:DNA polymerase III epsilon subunit-like protein